MGAGWILAVALVIFAAWLAWFFLAGVQLYEVSAEARVEVAAAAHPVSVEVSGRVLTNHMSLDKPVEAGDVLLELESSTEELALEEQESRVDTTVAEIEQLEEGIESNREALRSADAAGRARIAEAEAGFREAEAVVDQARRDRDRIKKLVDERILSDQGLEQAQTHLRVSEAEMSASLASIQRLRSDWDRDLTDRRSEIEELEREYSALQGQVSTRRSAAERLGLEIDKRLVIAAVSGRLGDVVDLPVGSFVAEGERVGSIIPESDELIVSAHFDPAQALGRIREGQTARLRLDGYPWTQYGTVEARVSRVGREVREGAIRVELAIVPDASSLIELGHGLPGTLEIQVEEVTPAMLVMRAVGRSVARPVARSAEG